MREGVRGEGGGRGGSEGSINFSLGVCFFKCRLFCFFLQLSSQNLVSVRSLKP